MPFWPPNGQKIRYLAKNKQLERSKAEIKDRVSAKREKGCEMGE
jgi:hypothetical protein